METTKHKIKIQTTTTTTDLCNEENKSIEMKRKSIRREI